MTQTLPISKVREQLPNIVDNANRKLEEYVITVNGMRAAVIISAAEYDSWNETNEILSDLVLLKAIKIGEKEIKAGKGIPWKEVKKDLDLT